MSSRRMSQGTAALALASLLGVGARACRPVADAEAGQENQKPERLVSDRDADKGEKGDRGDKAEKQDKAEKSDKAEKDFGTIKGKITYEKEKKIPENPKSN